MQMNSDGSGSKSDKSDNPVERARRELRRELPKRFYNNVSVEERENGFYVLLDGRVIRTPARRELVLANAATAALVAREFESQDTVIDPTTMPATRLANTTIDGIADDPQAVIEDILRFASTDLVCYRAGFPDALVDRQNRVWDPVIDWARTEIGANMVLAEGVMHVTQPSAAIAAISARLRTFKDPFTVAALHVMTTLTGSALLALAVAENHIGAEDAWIAAHVDEDWNISQWGEDDEARERRESRRRDMITAAAFSAGCGAYQV